MQENQQIAISCRYRKLANLSAQHNNLNTTRRRDQMDQMTMENCAVGVIHPASQPICLIMGDLCVTHRTIRHKFVSNARRE
jgi:hypothetical protein